MPGPWEKYAQPQAPPWEKYAQSAAPTTHAATAPPQQGFLGSFADASGLSTLGHAVAHPIDTVEGIPAAVKAAVQNSVDNVKQGVADYKQGGLSTTTRRDFGRALPIVGPALAQAQSQHDAGNNAGMAGTLAGTVAGFAGPEAAVKGVRFLAHPGETLTAPLRAGLDEPLVGSDLTPRQRYQSAQNLGVKLDAADATNSGILKMAKKVNENSLLGSGIYEKNRAANTAALNGSTNQFLSGLYDGDRESGGAAIQSALKQNQQGLQTAATQGFASLPADHTINGSRDVGTAAQDIAKAQEAYYKQFPSLQPSKALSVINDVASLGPGVGLADWLGDSAVKDKVFHGTTASFPEFDRPSFVTPSKDYANTFAEGEGGNVRPSFVKIEKPFHTDNQNLVEGAHVSGLINKLKDAGHDGIVYSKPGDVAKGPSGWGDDAAQYLPFSGEQLRSSFDPRNAVPATPPANFGTMQRLRSDLLDFGRNNPDIIKNQSGGWLQQLSGKADAAMTDAATGLAPEAQATFRDANAKWADMKGTYDDPSNPLYHAVRTPTPSTLYGGNGLGPRTPEAARALLPRLGQTFEDENPAAVGALRRGVVESALKTTNDGSPNFKTFGTQLNRIPPDYRAELFNLPQNQTLHDISNVSNLLGQDANPSGSAKLGQKMLEGSALLGAPLHPAPALAPLLQRPLAKLINSPKFTDYLMREAPAPVPQAAAIPLRARVPLSFALPALSRKATAQ